MTGTVADTVAGANSVTSVPVCHEMNVTSISMLIVKMRLKYTFQVYSIVLVGVELETQELSTKNVLKVDLKIQKKT